MFHLMTQTVNEARVAKQGFLRSWQPVQSLAQVKMSVDVDGYPLDARCPWTGGREGEGGRRRCVTSRWEGLDKVSAQPEQWLEATS